MNACVLHAFSIGLKLKPFTTDRQAKANPNARSCDSQCLAESRYCREPCPSCLCWKTSEQPKLSAMRDIPVPIYFTLLPDGQGLWIPKDFRCLPLTGSQTAADNVSCEPRLSLLSLDIHIRCVFLAFCLRDWRSKMLKLLVSATQCRHWEIVRRSACVTSWRLEVKCGRNRHRPVRRWALRPAAWLLRDLLSE